MQTYNQADNTSHSFRGEVIIGLRRLILVKLAVKITVFTEAYYRNVLVLLPAICQRRGLVIGSAMISNWAG